MSIRIIIDTKELKQLIDHLGLSATWLPPVVDREMIRLGYETIPVMKSVLRPRRYRGELEDKVDARYNNATRTLSVGPEGKRHGSGGGTFDAGLIAETGAHPKGNIPWQPIKEWALFRGKPVKEAYYILLSMRKEGVKEHPFLMDVLNNPGFKTALENAAEKMAIGLAAQAVAGGKVIGAAVTE